MLSIDPVQASDAVILMTHAWADVAVESVKRETPQSEGIVFPYVPAYAPGPLLYAPRVMSFQPLVFGARNSAVKLLALGPVVTETKLVSIVVTSKTKF